jgi:hypothetical protein
MTDKVVSSTPFFYKVGGLFNNGGANFICVKRIELLVSYNHRNIFYRILISGLIIFGGIFSDAGEGREKEEKEYSRWGGIWDEKEINQTISESSTMVKHWRIVGCYRCSGLERI